MWSISTRGCGRRPATCVSIDNISWSSHCRPARAVQSPPDVGDAPEPVPAAARIIEDPDHIAPQLRARFDQVVDFWPERVETMGMIDRQMRNAMVIDAIDPRGGSANLFMLRASELTHFDAQHIYQGRCTITTPARLPAAPAPAKASAR